MGYKQIEPKMAFAEVSLLRSMKHINCLIFVWNDEDPVNI
jgi:hypothetical protein